MKTKQIQQGCSRLPLDNKTEAWKKDLTQFDYSICHAEQDKYYYQNIKKMQLSIRNALHFQAILFIRGKPFDWDTRIFMVQKTLAL